MSAVRRFSTGATRDDDALKLDFEGSLSPRVLWAFTEYMRAHSIQADGEWRPADNWQKGWSRDVSMQSLMRHVFDLWLLHRGHEVPRPEDGHVPTMETALGGIMFNLQAYWLQWLREQEGQP